MRKTAKQIFIFLSVLAVAFAAFRADVIRPYAIRPDAVRYGAANLDAAQFGTGRGDALFSESGGAEDGAAVQASQIPFFNFFRKKKADDRRKTAPAEQVYLGGMPVGLTLHTKGVIVLGFGSVRTAGGAARPFADKAVKEGDVIDRIGGVEIFGADDVARALAETGGAEVTVHFTRKGKRYTERAAPALDSATGLYKLGLWIRDTSAGVGTVTYVKRDLRFGALGHPICDADVKDILPIAGGNVYKCSIVGVVKGQKGSAGELRGVFLKSRNRIGAIDKNNKFGVFGRLDAAPDNPLKPGLIECGPRAAVKAGPATIVTTVGAAPREYSIEIVKTNYQAGEKEKSMVLKVTDPALLAQTGGIVQGMSGSPILQDGRLIGAVTHVFVNDPTKGFGVYIDWMLNQ
ncbi:MAG: SpoIVB peptidase [Clostridiales bacterium]|jgi:stage IV sporulation protein B|nr:SpoIVB peptidase [Clostridiales bacterium]